MSPVTRSVIAYGSLPLAGTAFVSLQPFWLLLTHYMPDKKRKPATLIESECNLKTHCAGNQQKIINTKLTIHKIKNTKLMIQKISNPISKGYAIPGSCEN